MQPDLENLAARIANVRPPVEQVSRHPEKRDPYHPPAGNPRPAWVDEGFEVLGRVAYPGDPPKTTATWRLVVPSRFNIEAYSILERDLFNDEAEQTWKTHLEMLSDEELRDVSPRDAFCGLFDKIERVTRAYDHELERRRLKANAT